MPEGDYEPWIAMDDVVPFLVPQFCITPGLQRKKNRNERGKS
jgi:hypothetical protein